MVAPGGQYLLPNPWLHYWLTAQEILWFLTLVFLLWLAHRDIKRHVASSAPLGAK
jgi:hypothetical protein